MGIGGFRAAGVLVVVLFLVACAARVPVAPASLMPLAGEAPDFVVQSELPIRLSSGYTRTVPAKSRWRAVGVLPQGTVYRPVDSVFAIEGRQIHEAYLVVRGDTLQGFYLPGEGNYSALATTLQIPIHQGVQR